MTTDLINDPANGGCPCCTPDKNLVQPTAQEQERTTMRAFAEVGYAWNPRETAIAEATTPPPAPIVPAKRRRRIRDILKGES